MEVLNSILNRRSVRKFKQDPIKKDDLIKIIEAARWAPSATNRQVCRFVVIDNEELLKKIASETKIVFFKQRHAAQCPAMIVVCCKGDSWIEEIGAAIQNMLLTANSLEIGSCWIGAFSRSLVRELLKIPQNYKIYALILLGYPDETPDVPPRLSLGEICYLNEWKKPIVKPDKTLLPLSGVGSLVLRRLSNRGERDLKSSPLKIEKEK
ncbi:MAG: nitroreductase family protein [Candidatus Lokiarchaeota archaeon]|nr:nitroreductase family protein [Candidatus Lokiarchaeota archaeon]